MAVATGFVAALLRSRCSSILLSLGSLEEVPTQAKAARQGAAPTRVLRLFYVRDDSIQHVWQHAGERSIHEDAQEAAKAVLLLRPPPSLRLKFEAGADVRPGGACELGRRTRPGRQGQLLVPRRLSLKLRQQPPMLQASMRAEKFCKLRVLLITATTLSGKATYAMLDRKLFIGFSGRVVGRGGSCGPTGVSREEPGPILH